MGLNNYFGCSGQNIQEQGSVSAVPDEQCSLHSEDSGEQPLPGGHRGGLDRATQRPGEAHLVLSVHIAVIAMLAFVDNCTGVCAVNGKCCTMAAVQSAYSS